MNVQYFVLSADESTAHGPCSLAELRSALTSGSITHRSLMRRGGEQQWRLASEFHEVVVPHPVRAPSGLPYVVHPAIRKTPKLPLWKRPVTWLLAIGGVGLICVIGVGAWVWQSISREVNSPERQKARAIAAERLQTREIERSRAQTAFDRGYHAGREAGAAWVLNGSAAPRKLALQLAAVTAAEQAMTSKSEQDEYARGYYKGFEHVFREFGGAAF